MIYLSNFPMPPSSNNMFADKMRFDPRTRQVSRAGGKVKTYEYTAFEAQVDRWQNQRIGLIRAARARVQAELKKPGTLARVDLLFAVPGRLRPSDVELNEQCPRDKNGKRKGPPPIIPMFTGKNGFDFRIWDVSNRIKAAHDSLAEVLELPDHLLNVGLAEKVLIDDDGQQGVTVRVTFHRVRTWAEAFSELETEAKEPE